MLTHIWMSVYWNIQNSLWSHIATCITYNSVYCIYTLLIPVLIPFCQESLIRQLWYCKLQGSAGLSWSWWSVKSSGGWKASSIIIYTSISSQVCTVSVRSFQASYSNPIFNEDERCQKKFTGQMKCNPTTTCTAWTGKWNLVVFSTNSLHNKSSKVIIN